ncbi:uncharacterized protein LOC105701929 [Orussus abietinus]|uniref:uncharacterized protein LOC105701929 n=1 Tax=Orussus abietinus TaxID=222816 RepID=UPI000626CDF4|nr:uncharacterized protein LOC105701929 [Orussus abietinus]
MSDRDSSRAADSLKRRGTLSDFRIVAGLHLLLALASSTEVWGNSSKTSLEIARVLSRQKRYLIFPRGSNVQLVYCLTIAAFPRDGDLVLGLTAALAWELPSEVDPGSPTSLKRRSRSVLFPKIEAFLQAAGLDGRSCLMKALCEADRRDEAEIGSGTFLQELLHAVFALPKDGGKFESPEHRVYDYAHETKENCAAQYRTCEHSIYKVDL